MGNNQNQWMSYLHSDNDNNLCKIFAWKPLNIYQAMLAVW